ncbi:hypothetical protein NA57DRAFT_72160 [Rhizodiscina lignyota]|uniref:Heterokaryon incompatibility domain-containing protein n=1 Tax=Rhizodiscina lignyota TaxID=1504668 RepID=A0A9P4MAE7_9PEZI|nr:hypothetical protein NA57DRAFT_72160 [Rhizodiscina lignyota]
MNRVNISTSNSAIPPDARPINDTLLTGDSLLGPVRRLTPAETWVALQTPYQYQSLEPGCVRLVSFDEGTTADDYLVINIQNVLLCNATELNSYGAVSYVWGEPDFTESVLCEGGKSHLKVTKRLLNILRALNSSTRSSGEADFEIFPKFWIDAISINQNDVQERNHQVHQMAQIYRRASLVHIFLGTLSLHPHECLKSEWFHRRWVVQEVMSARVAIAHCDNGTSLSWDKLIRQTKAYLPKTPLPVDFKGTESAARMVHELSYLHDCDMIRPGILFLLLNFQHTQCKDPRDRLFAFFGVADDLAPPAQTNSSGEVGFCDEVSEERQETTSAKIDCSIDYNLTTTELYTYFAEAVLRSSYPFDLLHCAGAFRDRKLINDLAVPSSLPTWVPDWRLPPLYSPLLNTIQFWSGKCTFPGSDANPRLRYSKSGPFSKPDIQLHHNETQSRITVAGVRIGTVSAVLDSPPDPRWWHKVPYEYEKSGRKLDKFLGRVRVSVTTVSDQSRLGCAPPDVRTGDVVVCFAGGKTPFILRPFGQGIFQLIGDCFVWNFMDGEAFQYAPPLERFIIA